MLLRCPVCAPGRDAVTLAELTAARAAALASASAAIPPADGAFPDVDSDGNNSSASQYTGTTSRRTVEEVYASGVPTYDNPGTLVDKDGF